MYQVICCPTMIAQSSCPNPPCWGPQSIMALSRSSPERHVPPVPPLSKLVQLCHHLWRGGSIFQWSKLVTSSKNTSLFPRHKGVEKGWGGSTLLHWLEMEQNAAQPPVGLHFRFGGGGVGPNTPGQGTSSCLDIKMHYTLDPILGASLVVDLLIPRNYSDKEQCPKVLCIPLVGGLFGSCPITLHVTHIFQNQFLQDLGVGVGERTCHSRLSLRKSEPKLITHS